jgi:Protein of unknown function (DUF742).
VSGPGATESESANIVRPYARTRGRTRPEHAYPIEALVVTSLSGEVFDPNRTPEAQVHLPDVHAQPVGRRDCGEFARPLGVSRVLVGDLADAGLVLVHGTSDEAPNTDLLERVLGGLRKL